MTSFLVQVGTLMAVYRLRIRANIVEPGSLASIAPALNSDVFLWLAGAIVSVGICGATLYLLDRDSESTWLSRLVDAGLGALAFTVPCGLLAGPVGLLLAINTWGT
jgi:hypothetical protein